MVLLYRRFLRRGNELYVIEFQQIRMKWFAYNGCLFAYMLYTKFF